MRPYYADDLVTIYHADCREILPVSADLVLTDIPYGVTQGKNVRGGFRQLDKGRADVITVEETEIVRLLVSTGAKSHYVFAATEQLSVVAAEYVRRQYTIRLGAWVKNNPSPIGGKYLWLNGLEVCVFARKGRAYFHPDERCKPAVWMGRIEKHATTHPTEKPFWLFQRLVRASCPKGGVVLDPFLGSGTTAVAAKSLGRRAVGIELNEEWCEMAARRVERQGQSPQDLQDWAEQLPKEEQ